VVMRSASTRNGESLKVPRDIFSDFFPGCNCAVAPIPPSVPECPRVSDRTVADAKDALDHACVRLLTINTSWMAFPRLPYPFHPRHPVGTQSL
jgi:hypothetical protein